jgi:cell division septation protein DedD
MSDQGFHEVQLSGKQLVFLFMSAVVLAVVIFLLGVNVGRGVRHAVGDTEVSAQADPAPAKASDDAAAPAKPAEPELSYHDLLLGTNAAADKKPEAETPPPVGDTVPKPVAEPATQPATPPPQATAQPPAAAATPTATPPATAQKPSTSDWFLQVGAYSTQAVADGQVAKLKQLNVPAFVDVTPASKLFRVRIGPYADRAEAEQVKSRIARQGFTSSITR